MLGKLNIRMQKKKNEIIPLFYTIHEKSIQNGLEL